MSTFESDEIMNLNLDELFDELNGSQPYTDSSDDQITDDVSIDVESEQEPLNLTKTMSERINAVRRKTENETKEKVAKELGFDSYDELMRHKEIDLIRNNGLDENDVERVITPILEKRLANDPRFKRLEEIEKREKINYINSRLDNISQTLGTKVTPDKLTKEVIDLWSKGVDLEQAYYAVNSKQILSDRQSTSLTHLASASGTTSVKVRGLTADEKQLYRSIMPSISDEALSKKTVEIKNK